MGVEDPPPFSGQIKHGVDDDGDAADTVAQEALLRLEDVGAPDAVEVALAPRRVQRRPQG